MEIQLIKYVRHVIHHVLNAVFQAQIVLNAFLALFYYLAHARYVSTVSHVQLQCLNVFPVQMESFSSMLIVSRHALQPTIQTQLPEHAFHVTSAALHVTVPRRHNVFPV